MGFSGLRLHLPKQLEQLRQLERPGVFALQKILNSFILGVRLKAPAGLEPEVDLSRLTSQQSVNK